MHGVLPDEQLFCNRLFAFASQQNFQHVALPARRKCRGGIVTGQVFRELFVCAAVLPMYELNDHFISGCKRPARPAGRKSKTAPARSGDGGEIE
jgi:hypothetical protein